LENPLLTNTRRQPDLQKYIAERPFWFKEGQICNGRN
jgi:hypothetical protein